MMTSARAVVSGLLLTGILIVGGVGLESAEARCCERVAGGCDTASETGCAMGSSQNIFFPDPCDCVSDECVDPTQGNIACGTDPNEPNEPNEPNGTCGNGMTEDPEECDDGAANGTFQSCCNVNCTYKTNGAICEDGVFCDGLGACDGAGTCVENNGPLPCPDPERCDENNRSCASDAPAVSASVLVGLASLMLAAGVLTMRRLRRQHRI